MQMRSLRIHNDERSNPMIKELVRDEAILSTPCEPCTAEDTQLVQDLLDTIAATDDAAALAANQIGVTKAACVYLDENENPHVALNPTMKRALGAFKVEEGCITRDELSRVTRYARCTIEFDEIVDGKLVHRKKEMSDWTAQVLQHMIDHCKGKLV